MKFFKSCHLLRLLRPGKASRPQSCELSAEQSAFVYRRWIEQEYHLDCSSWTPVEEFCGTEHAKVYLVCGWKTKQRFAVNSEAAKPLETLLEQEGQAVPKDPPHPGFWLLVQKEDSNQPRCLY